LWFVGFFCKKDRLDGTGSSPTVLPGESEIAFFGCAVFNDLEVRHHSYMSLRRREDWWEWAVGLLFLGSIR
jgi:hypothetical protein